MKPSTRAALLASLTTLSLTGAGFAQSITLHIRSTHPASVRLAPVLPGPSTDTCTTPCVLRVTPGQYDAIAVDLPGQAHWSTTPPFRVGIAATSDIFRLTLPDPAGMRVSTALIASGAAVAVASLVAVLGTAVGCFEGPCARYFTPIAITAGVTCGSGLGALFAGLFVRHRFRGGLQPAFENGEPIDPQSRPR